VDRFPHTDFQCEPPGDAVEHAKWQNLSDSLDLFLYQIPDIICYFDLNAKPVYLNGVASSVFGWEYQADFLRAYFAPHCADQFEIEIVPLLKMQKEVWEGEQSCLNVHSNEYVPVWQKIFGTYDSRGRLSGYGMLARDLTTKKEKRP
jgi:PAS domain-containing protein